MHWSIYGGMLAIVGCLEGSNPPTPPSLLRNKQNLYNPFLNLSIFLGLVYPWGKLVGCLCCWNAHGGAQPYCMLCLLECLLCWSLFLLEPQCSSFLGSKTQIGYTCCGSFQFLNHLGGGLHRLFPRAEHKSKLVLFPFLASMNLGGGGYIQQLAMK